MFSSVSVLVLSKLSLPSAFWRKLAPVSLPECVLVGSRSMSLAWLLRVRRLLVEALRGRLRGWGGTSSCSWHVSFPSGSLCADQS